MHITSPCVVGLTWTLKDTLGDILDELTDPVEFLIGGDDLLHKIEHALEGHEAGDSVDLHLEPEDAFGDYDEQRVFLEKRGLFPAELEEGHTIEGHALPPGCNGQAPHDLLYTVTDLYPEHVVLDGNHPLAGIAIRIHLKVASVRAATDEEIKRGGCGTGFFRIDVVQDGQAGERPLH